jgi:hypothetical protein
MRTSAGALVMLAFGLATFYVTVLWPFFERVGAALDAAL